MRVTVVLEWAELAALEWLYPERSKSGAVRAAVLEVPEVELASEIARLERAAAAESPVIPRGAESAEARLSYREWREVQRALERRSSSGRSELVPGSTERFSAWRESLPIPRQPATGRSWSAEVAVTLATDDWRRIRSVLGERLREREEPDQEEVRFRSRHAGRPEELADARLREQHRLAWHRDTLRLRAAASKVPRPTDSAF